MYTGIVLGTEQVHRVSAHDGFDTILITDRQGFFEEIFLGASVSIDGVCLTVSQILKSEQLIGFDVSDLSKQVTTLKNLKAGAQVNVERSFKLGMENGGHNLYGHIEGVTEIVALTRYGQTLHLDLKIPDEKIKYFFLKGFIGLHGCSLTVNQVDKSASTISVDLIPETLRLTNFKDLQLGDQLNFEIDQTTRTLVDTIEGIYQNRLDQDR